MKYQERQVVSSVFTVKRQKKAWEALGANIGGRFAKFFPLFHILRKKTHTKVNMFFSYYRHRTRTIRKLKNSNNTGAEGRQS